MKVVIALGSNLGNREATLDFAASRLSEHLSHIKISSYIETDPVGGPEQPKYLNAVAVGETTLTAEILLNELQQIENEAGRTREVRWGARTLDLDIIMYGDVVSNDPTLTLPHPRAHERAFVLAPWLEVDPNAILGGAPISELLAKL